MNSNIRPRLVALFSRRYPALPFYLIEDRVADTLTDMELNLLPEEVRAIPEKYYDWASTVIDRALSHESKRLLKFVKLTDEVVESSEDVNTIIDHAISLNLECEERSIVWQASYCNRILLG